MNKEGWLKVGVVGVPICAYIMLVHLPTTSPYGYSSFPKEENRDTTDLYITTKFEEEPSYFAFSSGIENKNPHNLISYRDLICCNCYNYLLKA